MRQTPLSLYSKMILRPRTITNQHGLWKIVSPMTNPRPPPVGVVTGATVANRCMIASVGQSSWRRSSISLLSSSTYSKSSSASTHSRLDRLGLVDDAIPTGAQPLGEPIPSDEHACSVSLPTWRDVVGYEEGDRAVTSQMKCGYPRFVYHPYVLQLARVVLQQYGYRTTTITTTATTQGTTSSPSHLQPPRQEQVKLDEDCLLLPSAGAAARCQAFLQQALQRTTKVGESLKDNAFITEIDTMTSSTSPFSSSSPESASTTTTTTTMASSSSPPSLFSSSRIRIISLPVEDIHAVMFPAETWAGMEAKAYWQHTGEIVSSRRAERALRAMNIVVETNITADRRCHSSAFAEQPITTNTTTTTTTTTTTGTTRTATPITATAITPDVKAENPGLTSVTLNPFIYDELRNRIAGWTAVPNKDYVFLTTSGMASIYTALRSARRLHWRSYPDQIGGASIVYGFPYLDTLKLCSRVEFCPAGVEFFGRGDTRDLQSLERLLQTKGRVFCALFTEVPSNPLLQCPDLVALRRLADEYHFALIVDDTISTFWNVDLLHSGLADALCSSLTKLVSGRGDVMGGSVVLNPFTERGLAMQHDLLSHAPGAVLGLHSADAAALLTNSTSFPDRCHRVNTTAEALRDWLHEHPAVQQVYYPKGLALYDQVKNTSSRRGGPPGGYGGLMSLILHAHMCQRTFYDALNVAKGPSLGTNFTLVCPYTLLAHYHELDFAMSYNVPPNLLRISIGLESFDELKSKFEEAFRASQLYPKMTVQPRTTSHRNDLPVSK